LSYQGITLKLILNINVFNTGKFIIFKTYF